MYSPPLVQLSFTLCKSLFSSFLFSPFITMLQLWQLAVLLTSSISVFIVIYDFLVEGERSLIVGTCSAGLGGSDSSSEEAGLNRLMESRCGESILPSSWPSLSSFRISSGASKNSASRLEEKSILSRSYKLFK